MEKRAMAGNEPGSSLSPGRLYYLDWLRVGAILVVLLFHCAKIFDFHTSVMFNQVRSPVLSAFREFGFIWLMPLFFVISGASVWFSTARGGAGRFLKSKILRLLVPLVLVGTFVIDVIYVYVERIFQGRTELSFFDWYPQFFQGMYPAGGNFAPVGLGTHLWYLLYLFVFSLLLMPLFLRSKKSGTSPLSRLAFRLEKPWALVLLFIPVSISVSLFEYFGLGFIRVAGGWDPVSFLLFFAYGYLIFSNQRIRLTVERLGPVCLIFALVTSLLYTVAHFGWLVQIPGLTSHNLAEAGALLPLDKGLWIASQAAQGLMAWCWMIGFIGCATRLLNFSNRFLAYASEAVLPFYIMHHVVVYLIGFYVVQWNLGVGTKFLSIAVLSFLAIILIYEVLIRRVNILRFLFGMKWRKPKTG